MTPDERRAALVEMVVSGMVAGDSGPEGSELFAIHLAEFGDGYRKSAVIALSLALEEAAKECMEQMPRGLEPFTEGYRMACEENARNIRALKGDING